MNYGYDIFVVGNNDDVNLTENRPETKNAYPAEKHIFVKNQFPHIQVRSHRVIVLRTFIFYYTRPRYCRVVPELQNTRTQQNGL